MSSFGIRMSEAVETIVVEECKKSTVEEGKRSEVGGTSNSTPVSVPESSTEVTKEGVLPISEEIVEHQAGFFRKLPPWMEEGARYRTDYYDKERVERWRALRNQRQGLQCVGTSKEEDIAPGEIPKIVSATGEDEVAEKPKVDSDDAVKRNLSSLGPMVMKAMRTLGS
ncbi:hypothetical protein M758_UG175700 [Ceratodon purpureus]|nr:hypothetical protein M758_UG175700 [Ceratodon purpureus]